MPNIERVGPVATVFRGLGRRCGRCGSKGLFESYFRIRERCPRCGYRFKREEGFFTGVILVNFSAVLVVLWLGIMAWILWRSTSGSDGSVVSALLVGGVVAALFPIAFYPVSVTTWAALDLAMRPLEPEEEADAATWVAREA